MKDLQDVYDNLFARAASIIRKGLEHQMFALTFSPSAEGYKPHGVVMLAGDKDGIATALSAIVRKAPQMYLVVHISEAWLAMVEVDEKWDMDRPVSEHPRAREAVTFTFFREGEVHLATCMIRRPENVLEKGELTKANPGEIEGRFIPVHVR